MPPTSLTQTVPSSGLSQMTQCQVDKRSQLGRLPFQRIHIARGCLGACLPLQSESGRALSAAADRAPEGVRAPGRPQVTWPQGQAGTTKSSFSGAGFLFSEREEILAFLIQCYLSAIARTVTSKECMTSMVTLGKYW